MKKYVIIIVLAITTLVEFTSCSKYEMGNPLASTQSDFTYTTSNGGNAPCVATFVNNSINAASYHWDFGNGQTSNEANPAIPFTEPGLYTVTLTCTAINNVHYNSLTKTLVVNVKDPNTGKVQVLYFTSRNPNGGGAHYVLLNDNTPIVVDFDAVEFSRPYGIVADTAHGKVYVSDYDLGVIYRFNSDGKDPVKILDANVSGQEITGSPEAMMVVGDKLYWGRPGGIYRCNLDGTNPEVYINTESSTPEYPIDMQYDPVNQKVYLVNDKTDYTGGYFTMNFDGTALSEVIENIDGTAIEVNTQTGKVYIAGYASEGTAMPENGIYMCNIDGSQLAKIGDYGSKATWGIAIDPVKNKIFWSFKNSNSNPDGKIIRANADGSDQEDWITGVSPHAMQAVWIKL